MIPPQDLINVFCRKCILNNDHALVTKFEIWHMPLQYSFNLLGGQCNVHVSSGYPYAL